MILVALLAGATAAGSTEDSGLQARVATALGITAYEARILLASPAPTILLTTADVTRADAVVSALRPHGADVVAVDAQTIVPAESMVPLDRFTLDDGAGGPAGRPLPYRASATTGAIHAGDRALPYADILCLLRAVHRARAVTDTRTTERRFDIGKSLLSGGLSNSKLVTTTSSEASYSREPVLYLFRRSGETPWILRERAHYEGLGAARALTAVENFTTTVRLLRERAPEAAYDDRLVRIQRSPERAAVQGTAARSTVTTSSASGIDALAHLLALSLAR